jgi:hypothetical protein
MTSTTHIQSSASSDAADLDDLFATVAPLLAVVPVAGPPAFALAGFGVVLLLLLVPPLALVATLVGVLLLGAAAVVAAVGLAAAIVAAPFWLARHLRGHRLPHLSVPVASFRSVRTRRV